MAGKLRIELGIDEEEQMSSYQNAALHGGPGQTAISIDAEASFPEGVSSEQDIERHLKEALEPLVEKGWNFNIFIGDSIDKLNEQDG